MIAAGTPAAVNRGLTGTPTTRATRIDPRFNAVTMVDSSGNSNYHSFQFQAVRRMTAGLALSASYTWSASIDNGSDALGVLFHDGAVQQDPFNDRNNRGRSAFDVPHRFTFTHNWDIPFKSDNPFMKHVLGGWQWSGIFVAQSGTPVNLFSGAKGGVTDPLLLGYGTATTVQRPDVVGPITLNFTPTPGGSPAAKAPGSGLAQPLIGTFGNMGRNVLRINGLANFDWTLGKDFPITERVRIQFQAHMFNVFNHPSFALVNANARNLISNVFGYYDGTQTTSRNTQFNLRLIF
jgi:hypothetical protein